MGTRGGIRHRCQAREIPCPVPARIMDREISWGFTRQQAGVFFSRARGKLYTFVGHVLPPDQRRTQHQFPSCSTDTPQTDHVWNERPLPCHPLDYPPNKTMTVSSRELYRGCLYTWPPVMHRVLFPEPWSRELPCGVCVVGVSPTSPGRS
jgi:hypothetical protein